MRGERAQTLAARLLGERNEGGRMRLGGRLLGQPIGWTWAAERLG
jgi:hypothetical protein